MIHYHGTPISSRANAANLYAFAFVLLGATAFMAVAWCVVQAFAVADRLIGALVAPGVEP